MRTSFFRWRCIRCGRLVALVIFCSILIYSLTTVHKLSVAMRISEAFYIEYCAGHRKLPLQAYGQYGESLQKLYVPRGVTRIKDGLTQADVDYFAKNIQVTYRVVQNLSPAPENYKDDAAMMLYEAEVTLVNRGNKVFPNKGWRIFFNQILGVEPAHIFRDSIALRAEHNVLFRHWNGELYSLEPTETFESIGPKKTKIIRYYSSCCSVAFTDIFPNWYIVFRGLSPRVIYSTVGEPDRFVALHNTSNSWKRIPDKHHYSYDRYNPPTAKDRFTTDSVKDLGKATIPVIPTPLKVEVHNPSSTLNVFSDNWVIVSEPVFQSASTVLIEKWKINLSTSLPGSNYIQFIQQEVEVQSHNKSLLQNETYELSVKPAIKSITIKAMHATGAFYAVQSLLSLTDQNGNIAETVIKDGPRYRYRGLMIDIARNFHRKETIMRYIDAMAMYKLNKLHLHLTDDEGWRLEIPDLPELTDVGSKRCHDTSETMCLLPFLGSGPNPVAPGSGFYTVEDYKDILRYAVAHHVEVIPEIDMPGHSHAAIRAMQIRFLKYASNSPKEATRYLLSDLQDTSQYSSVQNFNDGVINPCVQSAYTFIEKIITTLKDMHRDISPLQTFHFGGDEVPKTVWINSSLCKELDTTGLDKSFKQIFAESVGDLASHYNLNLAAWEDGLMNEETPIPRKNFPQKNIYVFAWNNLRSLHQAKRAYTLANAGYKVVLTPATSTYLDHPYEPDPKERGLIWATRFISTKKIFKIMPENIYPSEELEMGGQPIPECSDTGPDSECPDLKIKDNIEGIQGTLFGELTRTSWIIDFMVLPRLLALAERAWHAAPWEYELNKTKRYDEMEKDWVNFANTLGYKELARLDKKGFLYRIPPPGAIVTNNIIKASVEFPGLEVQISMDGGSEWTQLPLEGKAFQKGKDIQLRTKAADGNRYSRIIHFK